MTEEKCSKCGFILEPGKDTSEEYCDECYIEKLHTEITEANGKIAGMFIHNQRHETHLKRLQQWHDTWKASAKKHIKELEEEKKGSAMKTVTIHAHRREIVDLKKENKNLKSMLQYCHKYAKEKGFEIKLPSEKIEEAFGG